MERVVVVRRDSGDPIIATVNKVREYGGLSEDGYAVRWAPGQRSALDTSSIVKGREVGTVTVQKNGADVPYDVTFAFVAHAFFPDVPIEK